MKKLEWKRLMPIALACVVMMGMTGCGDKKDDSSDRERNRREEREADKDKDKKKDEDDEEDKDDDKENERVSIAISEKDIVEGYYNQAENSENYSLDFSMGMAISVSADTASGDSAGGMKVSMGIPVDVKLTGDIYEDKMKAKLNMKASMGDQALDQTAEVYVDGKWTYMNDGTGWEKSESESGGMENIGAALGEVNMACLSDEPEYDRDLDEFVIVKNLKEAMSEESYNEFIESLTDDSMSQLYGGATDEVEEALETAKMTFTFDNDYRLLEAEMDKLTIKGEEDGVTVSMDLSMSSKFSNHGKVKESDVEVPDDVKAEAEGEAVDKGENDGEVDSRPSTGTSTSGTVGSYRGVAFGTSDNDWDDTFGADGWVLEDNDFEGYLLFAEENSKYPGVDLSISTEDKNWTVADVMEKGFLGYDINVSFADGKLPDMSWNGVTFGSSLADVEAAYGDGYDYYGSTDGTYNSYQYELPGGSELTFYIFDQSKGVEEVQLYVYSH